MPLIGSLSFSIKQHFKSQLFGRCFKIFAEIDFRSLQEAKVYKLANKFIDSAGSEQQYLRKKLDS